MYRLVLYVLVALLAVAIFLCFFGLLPYSPVYLIFSTLFILSICWGSNYAFAKWVGVTTNVESVYITALILALIIAPIAPNSWDGVTFLIFVSVGAMASKYIFTIGRKHIFNPAAFGVALGALVLGQSATWWIDGNVALLPFVLIGGLLIVRKLRRFDLVLTFSVIVLLTAILTAQGSDFVATVVQVFQYASFLFFALVMLTEPLTMPPTRTSRILYGAIVGLLFTSIIRLGSFYFTPELALLVGNIFVYVVSPKGRFMLTLIEKNEIVAGTLEFVFTPDKPLTFRPGQYLEWTLGHTPSDDRGNRRYFTIASSPTESTVRLGVRISESKSTFKRALKDMQIGDVVSASSLAGDFVLPEDAKKKLVFIAGGIGITPFRSMVQYLMDTKDARPVTLLYSNKTASEIAYKSIFDAATQTIGMKTVYALTAEPNPVPGTYAGKIDSTLIAREIPDYKDRTFYISGPHGMVTAFEKILHNMGVSRFRIKTDYFPGFA